MSVAQTGYADNGDGTVSATTLGPAVLKSAFQHDLLGRTTTQIDYTGDGSGYAGSAPGTVPDAAIATYRAIGYDAKGRVETLSDTVRQGNDIVRTDTTNAYGDGTGSYALGAVVSSSATTYRNGVSQSSSTTTTSYDWYDGAVQARVDYTSQGSTYHTYYTNDARGQLVSANVQDGRARDVRVTRDALGQAVRRDEVDGVGYNPSTGTGGDPHEIWYRFDGHQIGYVGNNGSDNTDYTSSIAQRTAPAPSGTPGPFRGGEGYGGSYADFDQNYDAITTFSQGAAGGVYTVRQGDTLAGIAAAVWGDANLWYKLAAANGLSAGSSLSAGQTLTIPSGVTKSGNSASTTRPYDPSDAYGDTSPTTPKPQPAASGGGGGCGVLGQILLVVIAIAVTLVLKAPITTFLNGGVAGAGAGSAAAIGGAAAAGAAGSIVSQSVGLATGIQDKFSFAGVALSAIGAGIGQGLGSVAALDKIGGSAFLGNVARGALGSALTQGIGVVTGLQSKFDFVGVAAAGIGAGVGGALGTRFSGLGEFGQQLAANTAGGLANAATRSLIEGTDFGDNVIAALPDIIAQTVGGFVAGKIAGSGRSRTPEMPIDLLPPGVYDTTPDPVVAPSGQASAASGPAATDADAQPGDIVVTGTRLRDAIYRPGIDAGLMFRAQEFREVNPRARMGGNGGPPLEDWTVLRQLGRTRPNGPAGALYGVLDHILDPTTPSGLIFGLLDDGLDITGPANASQAEYLDGLIHNSVAEILSIDPNHRWPDRMGASGNEAQSLRWKVADADFYLSDLAATKYISQKDVGALQTETLKVYQRFVDQGFQQALDEAAAGTLYQPSGWSRAQAIGSRMDGFARRSMLAFYAEHRINPGLDINVTVNNRLATQPEGSYRVPDVRVGGVIFDASISPKQSYTPQIQGFYSSPVVRSVFIVRPTSMGGSYVLPKPGGR